MSSDLDPAVAWVLDVLALSDVTDLGAGIVGLVAAIWTPDSRLLDPAGPPGSRRPLSASPIVRFRIAASSGSPAPTAGPGRPWHHRAGQTVRRRTSHLNPATRGQILVYAGATRHARQDAPASFGIGHPEFCASQYFSSSAPNDGKPGDAVSSTDPSTWHWTDAWFDQNVGSPTQLAHFLVDTSRNGLGAWTPPAGKYTGDAQTWCNPPGRGVGARPTADTGTALVDAYLYVKTIGQSDGSCTRSTAGPGDPEYGGTVDPPAGAWWPTQALTLANNAVPGLRFNLTAGHTPDTH